MQRTSILLFLIACATFAHSQDTQQFDAEKYAMGQRATLMTYEESGASPDSLARVFANQYNEAMRLFPGSSREIIDLTNVLVNTFNVGIAVEKGVMTHAYFKNAQKTPAPSPVPEIERIQDESSEPIYIVVEQMPLFPGCENVEDYDNQLGTRNQKYQCSMQKLLDYVAANLKYPSEARDQGIQGRVVVKFVVETDGSISDVECTHDIGAGCGAEAVRVVNSLNSMDKKWTPAIQRGKPVRVQLTLPVSFKL